MTISTELQHPLKETLSIEFNGQSVTSSYAHLVAILSLPEAFDAGIYTCTGAPVKVTFKQIRDILIGSTTVFATAASISPACG